MAERHAIQRLLSRLNRQPLHCFPDANASLDAPNTHGVYVIRDAERHVVQNNRPQAAMIDAVRSPRGTIWYSELVARISAVRLEAHDMRLDGLLEEISKDENAAGRGMLSVVVVHKTGDMQPGPGFFNLADSLGRDTTDRVKCWAEEFETVRAHWARP